MSENGGKGVMAISKSGLGNGFNYLISPRSPDIDGGGVGGVNMSYDYTTGVARQARAAGYGVTFDRASLPETWESLDTGTVQRFRSDLKLTA
jgi:hypothetical protein